MGATNASIFGPCVLCGREIHGQSLSDSRGAMHHACAAAADARDRVGDVALGARVADLERQILAKQATVNALHVDLGIAWADPPTTLDGWRALLAECEASHEIALARTPGGEVYVLGHDDGDHGDPELRGPGRAFLPMRLITPRGGVKVMRVPAPDGAR